MALEEAMDKFLSFTHVNILYIDLSDGQWALLTHILDNGVLYVSIVILLFYMLFERNFSLIS